MTTPYVTRLRLAAVAAGLLATSAAHASGLDQKTFDLAPNPAFVHCLAAFPDDPSRPPQATVTVVRGKLNDQLQIQLRNIKQGLAFDLFTVERTSLLSDGTPDPQFVADGGSFGLAWYQSDLEIKNNNHNVTKIQTVLVDQIFGFDSAVGLAPTNTFHVGFWFNRPKDAAGCGFTGTTPFNGEHTAGPLAFISRPDATTQLGPLCVNPDLSKSPVVCNP